MSIGINTRIHLSREKECIKINYKLIQEKKMTEKCTWIRTLNKSENVFFRIKNNYSL